MSEHDEELEALLSALAPDAAAREALEEEHRQLEKDLLRLSDPLPPADFLNQVMAKVEAQPVRPMSRAEVISGLAMAVGIAAAAVAAVLVDGSVAGVGSSLASFFVFLRSGFAGFGSAAAAIWRTAPVPFAAALTATLMTSAILMRRVGAALPESKVS